MPPRLHLPSRQITHRPASQTTPYVCRQCRHASLATATVPAAPIEQGITGAPPILRYPKTQPPSYKPPEFRKSQLHRQYQSMLRSSPLTIVFQHNNLTATELMGIRRELTIALRKVDEAQAALGNDERVGSGTKLQIVQTSIFASALKVVEFWNPNFEAEAPVVHPTDPKATSSKSIADVTAHKSDPAFTHGLSKKAYKFAKQKNKLTKHGLEAVMSGPLAVLSMPSVSPQHLKAAIRILAPSKEFPAPKRRESPGYHETAVQNGLQKLLLLAARVEGKVFDTEGTKWVGSIEGGLDGLRGQLVAMLQGVGAGVTNTLEAASRSLYVTVEGRRGMLEKEEKGEDAGGQ